MRIFNPRRLNVIFLVPVAVAASQSDGCSTTPDEVALNRDQVEQLVVGNTVTGPERSAFAYIAADGMLRGRDLPGGGTIGTWRITEDGALCAMWSDQSDTSERCSTLTVAGSNSVTWSGIELLVIEGNARSL